MLSGNYDCLFTVCMSVLNKFSETVTDKDRSDKEVLETKLKKFCKTLKGKDERFVSILKNFYESTRKMWISLYFFIILVT